MTATATKPKRSTWQEWLPPDGIAASGVTVTFDQLTDGLMMLSREELVKLLNNRGVDVSADNLRSWEHLGILPQGTRKRHEGATRTLYPAFMADVVMRLRELQSFGVELADMGPALRQTFLVGAIRRSNLDFETKVTVLTAFDISDLPKYAIESLATIARFQETVIGSSAKTIRLTIDHENGYNTSYVLIHDQNGDWSVSRSNR